MKTACQMDEVKAEGCNGDRFTGGEALILGCFFGEDDSLGGVAIFNHIVLTERKNGYKFQI